MRFGHFLLLQAVVEAAQVLGLFLRQLRVVRHLEHLQALIGFLTGDQLVKAWCCLKWARACAASPSSS